MRGRPDGYSAASGHPFCSGGLHAVEQDAGFALEGAQLSRIVTIVSPGVDLGAKGGDPL